MSARHSAAPRQPALAGTLIPAIVDNTYRGYRAGRWLLGFVLFVKVAQIVSLFVDGPGIVADADGGPLATFSEAASRTVVAAFTGMGISRLVICVMLALVLWRYRSAIPLTFGLLALHDVARELVLRPVRMGTPIGLYVNAGLLVLTLAGIALALPRHAGEGRREQQA